MTEEEEGKTICDLRDGKPAPDLDPRLAATAALLQLALSPKLAQLPPLHVRRTRRWSRRIAAASPVIAASILLWFVLTRPVLPPAPSPEIAKAAQSGDPATVDMAMQAYRRDMVNVGLLKGAEEAHTRADAAIAAGNFDAAREALSTLKGRGGFIERDAWFRLATVELRAGKADAAITNADRGLALGRPADIFTVNLLMARAAAYKATGDLTKASEDLHAAIVVIDELFNKALEDE